MNSRAHVEPIRAASIAVGLVAILLGGDAPTALAQSAQGTAGAPVCIYQDRTFSAGAAICPHARFMLMCAQENDKLTWKIVSDPSLSSMCRAPTIRAGPQAVTQRVRRTAAVRAPPPVVSGGARCFTFNNKQYCE